VVVTLDVYRRTLILVLSSNMTAHIDKAVLAVLDPHQVSAVMTPKLASAGGYPFPGPQSPTAASAMSKNCFVDDNTWRLIAGKLRPE